jgi:hypothetical protein
MLLICCTLHNVRYNMCEYCIALQRGRARVLAICTRKSLLAAPAHRYETKVHSR